MSDQTATSATASAAAPGSEPPFASLEETLASTGPGAAIDQLIEHLDRAGGYRAMLDALLLKARHEIGLPLVAIGRLTDLPEPARTQYEEKYVAAIRLVGSRHLDKGDIPSAWAYFRAIAETEPVAAAIDAYRPTENDERLSAIIEVALNHGVNPGRGFELILENYGTCPAITAFEQLPPHDEAARAASAETLIRHLHRELVANLRSEFTSRGQVLPPAGSLLADLVAGRPWLFTDDSYHIDISHLASVVRTSLIARDPEALALAADLTEYGRCLSPRLVFEGSPPFERIFEDHGVYLKALLGRDLDQAVAHFQRKLKDEMHEEGDPVPAAQVLVNLLLKSGKPDAAIDVAAAHLAGFPESALGCPSLAQLCQQAGELRAPGRGRAATGRSGDVHRRPARIGADDAMIKTLCCGCDLRQDSGDVPPAQSFGSGGNYTSSGQE